MQTVHDVFAVAPLGAGAVDPTAGSALVTAYFTGGELKNLLEFPLRFGPSRAKPGVVTAIELGDLGRGYRVAGSMPSGPDV